MLNATRRRVVVGIAALLMVSGAGALLFAAQASAAGTLTVTPNTGLTNGTALSITGTGFAGSSTGALMECSNAPGQPTVTVAWASPSPSRVPRGRTSSRPWPMEISPAPSTRYKERSVRRETATDSNGNPGSTDAALYPCPPTTAQQAAGDTCVVEMEIAGVVTSSPIYFTGQSIPTTTTTTTPGAPPCTPAPTTSAGPPSLTATPGTCLNGGSVVTLTGSGYDDSSLGTVLECNNAPGQPTVALPAPVSENVPVSCSGIAIANAKATTATGDLPAGLTFTIISPTPGPPCGAGYLITTCPTDSSGGNAATDAAAYPCPPTAAQTGGRRLAARSTSATKGGRRERWTSRSSPTPRPPTGIRTRVHPARRAQVRARRERGRPQRPRVPRRRRAAASPSQGRARTPGTPCSPR